LTAALSMRLYARRRAIYFPTECQFGQLAIIALVIIVVLYIGAKWRGIL
jgi:hypothetical protein